MGVVSEWALFQSRVRDGPGTVSGTWTSVPGCLGTAPGTSPPQARWAARLFPLLCVPSTPLHEVLLAPSGPFSAREVGGERERLQVEGLLRLVSLLFPLGGIRMNRIGPLSVLDAADGPSGDKGREKRGQNPEQPVLTCGSGLCSRLAPSLETLPKLGSSHVGFPVLVLYGR